MGKPINKAIVVYSFGSRRVGRCRTNIELAKFSDDLHKKTGVPVIAQIEVADCMKSRPLLVVKKHRVKNSYLGTEEVTAQVASFMKKSRLHTAILVAQPFLHRHKCRKILENRGISVDTPKMPWIPFDRRSDQWWTRGPESILAYAILQGLTGRSGK